MKKLIYLLLIPIVLLCLVGCDDKPPKESDLKNWLNRKINDNYKIKSKEDTSNIDPKDYKITFELESQYGFDFEASVEYRYVEQKSDACGDWSGYKRIYETNYDDKVMNYFDDEIKEIENKYSGFNKSSYTYYFTIEKYKELKNLINFAYEYYSFIDNNKIKMTHDKTEVRFRFNVENMGSEILVKDEVLKDKDALLKELQYYYVYEVQQGNLVDSSIPKMDTLVIKDWYINDTPISEIVENPDPIYHLVNSDEYAVYVHRGTFKVGYTNFIEKIIENKLNGTYEEEDSEVFVYTINDKKHKIVAKEAKYFKLDSNKIYYVRSPRFYPFGINNRDDSSITIDDFAKIIDCTYKIKSNAVYFYSK